MVAADAAATGPNAMLAVTPGAPPSRPAFFARADRPA